MSDEFIAGSGAIYVAPAGTPTPNSATDALDPAFVHVGLTTEDGVRFTTDRQFRRRRLWPDLQPSRVRLIAQETQVAWSMLEWNPVTVPIAFAGGTVAEPDPTVWTFEPPPFNPPLASIAVVIDMRDGDRIKRLVIDDGTVVSSIDTTFNGDAPASLPVTVAVSNIDGRPAWRFHALEAFAGVFVLVGDGPPPGGLGSDGDVWLDMTTGDLYAFEGGPPPAPSPMRDPLYGDGPPPDGLGTAGDAYIDLLTGDLYTR